MASFLKMIESEVKEVLKQRGAKARVARLAGVKRCTVSNWLAGKTKSENIAKAVAQVAKRLIAKGSSND